MEADIPSGTLCGGKEKFKKLKGKLCGGYARSHELVDAENYEADSWSREESARQRG